MSRSHYQPGGDRFAGATFDATGAYRLRASLATLAEAGWTVDAIHAHVQLPAEHADRRAVDRTGRRRARRLAAPAATASIGATSSRSSRRRRARSTTPWPPNGVVVDHRADRLRVGLGIYHDEDDVTDRLAPALLAAARETQA